MARSVINGRRAFIARRRALRPGQEYRLPTEQEWNDFIGHLSYPRFLGGF